MNALLKRCVLRTIDCVGADRNEASPRHVLQYLLVDKFREEAAGDDTHGRCEDEGGGRGEEDSHLSGILVCGKEHGGDLGLVTQLCHEYGGEHGQENF